MAIQREYLSPNDVAEYLGVSPFTIRRYIKLGELKAVKLLGGFRVHRDDLQRFLKAHEVNPTEEALGAEETEEGAADDSPRALTPRANPAPALPQATKENGTDRTSRPARKKPAKKSHARKK